MFLIGIAGSLAKVIKYIKFEEIKKESWNEMIRNRINSNYQNRSSNYTDPNWDGLSKNSQNWDGLPKQKD